MKILIITDSFKGTLTSNEVGVILQRVIKRKRPDAHIKVIPFADGGEGTIDSILNNSKGYRIRLNAKDPLFRDIETEYGVFENGRSAIIEMASISGLTLLKKSELNPMVVNTYGTGELIADSINKGCKNIYIGIGGSATNDAGLGMSSAVGIKFLDQNGKEVFPIPKHFYEIKNIVTSGFIEGINELNIKVLADVTNPLCGIKGASRVYAAQKGADEKMIAELEERLEYIAKLIKKELGVDYSNYPGSGAAGGLGYGLMTFLNAEIINGADFLIDLLEIKEKIKNADIIITGEGKLDYQTQYDKLPMKISKLAKAFNKKCICVCGTITNEDRERYKNDFDEIYSVVDEKVGIEESLKNPAKCLEKIAEKIELL